MTNAVMIRVACCIALLIGQNAANAQVTDAQLPISLSSEYSAYDGKNSMMTFRGLRLTQGLISIEADEGRASKLNFKEAIWELSGNVVISVDGGRIDCESASLSFADNTLRVADIRGAPATFEIQRLGADDATYAEAEQLRYDLTADSIEFSGNAKIIEGGNQIASNYLVYNIAEQRIQAEGSAEDDGKVKITFTPDGAEPGAPDGEEPGDAPE